MTLVANFSIHAPELVINVSYHLSDATDLAKTGYVYIKLKYQVLQGSYECADNITLRL